MNETKTLPLLTFDQLERGYSFWQNSGELPIELSDLQDEPVQIRGFLYKTNLNHQEARFLASEPNLKSCCVASPGKKGVQLIVTGDLPNEIPSTAVSLHGNLQFFGEVQGPFYGLRDASIQANASSYGLPAIIAMLSLFLVFVWRYFAK